MKAIIKKIPIFGNIARRIYWYLQAMTKRTNPFPGSGAYWEKRYSGGGTSGEGSYGKYAEFKASVINNFIAKHNLQSIIEFGCGDGNQLTLSKYPAYIGLDVSETAISACMNLFAGDDSKHFKLVSEYNGEQADVSLSLDVIYHLIEDDVYENYMKTLFGSANKYVIIYSSNFNSQRSFDGTHVRHRKFTDWIQQKAPEWEMIDYIPNKYPDRGIFRHGSKAAFFIFYRTEPHLPDHQNNL